VTDELVWDGPVEVRVTGAVLEAPDDLRSRVDELWAQERDRRPQLTDGTILSVQGIEAGVVQAQPCPYRLFVARERDTALRDALGIQPIGVSGILLLGRGDAVRVVVGRRAADVTEYPGALELVPSGGIDLSFVGADGVVDTAGCLLAELEEEVGIERTAVDETQTLGLALDRGQQGYDVCIAIRASNGHVIELPEYAETMVLDGAAAAALLSTDDDYVVPTSRAILATARRAGLL
jgi:hypothetical protein